MTHAQLPAGGAVRKLAVCGLVILGLAPTAAARGSTRPGGASRVAERAPLAGKVIVVDPGHNPGNAAHAAQINRPVQFGAGTKPCDTTGTATLSGYTEAAYTLDVAYRVVALLRTAGAKVVLTHTRTSPAWVRASPSARRSATASTRRRPSRSTPTAARPTGVASARSSRPPRSQRSA